MPTGTVGNMPASEHTLSQDEYSPKGPIRRWLAELLISPTGGCRPRAALCRRHLADHIVRLPHPGSDAVTSPSNVNSGGAAWPQRVWRPSCLQLRLSAPTAPFC